MQSFSRLSTVQNYQGFHLEMIQILVIPRLKLGDRFFYDSDADENVKFNEDQLQEIRKTFMARILFHNVDSI
jgi:hypothetical protein